MPHPPYLRPLFDGPLDVIGDVHGELDALMDLLAHLGYDTQGRHPAGRRLAFIGDLCDRGPDSPAVIDLVREWVAAGRAQCLLGNHELNVLRGARKEGNGWCFEEDHDRAEGRFTGSRALPAAEREAVREFFASLPLALERADLRLVHATWDEAALSLLAACAGPVAEVYEAYAKRAGELIRRARLDDRARADWRAHGHRLKDPQSKPPLLDGLARVDHLYQMGNPVRILTSGVEAIAAEPFFASGKWRMLDRVKWWHGYRHAKPVLVGHYWRWPTPEARAAYGRGESDLFEGAPHDAWHGARQNVFCLDFGVGARYLERAEGRHTAFRTRLGALRWPERELVFDNGGTVPASQSVPVLTS